jgi:hypothetical protein
MELGDRQRQVWFVITIATPSSQPPSTRFLGTTESGSSAHPSGHQTRTPTWSAGSARPPRVSRSAADRRPPSARTRPARLRKALQPRAATPRTQPATTGREPSVTCRNRLPAAASSHGPPRPTCLPHPRVQHPRSRVRIKFLQPRGSPVTPQSSRRTHRTCAVFVSGMNTRLWFSAALVAGAAVLAVALRSRTRARVAAGSV